MVGPEPAELAAVGNDPVASGLRARTVRCGIASYRPPRRRPFERSRRIDEMTSREVERTA
jgi:hypothetical protein